MRYGLIALIAVILGIGEYAFVEYYPLNERQRAYKFSELPIVKQIAISQEEDLVEQAIEDSENGCIHVDYRKEGTCWFSVEEWRKDRSDGHGGARWLGQRLKDQEKAKKSLPELIEQAQTGDPTAAFQMYMGAKYTGQKQLAAEALDLLKNHPTAYGRNFHFGIVARGDSTVDAIDSGLWMMRVVIENWRDPRLTEQQFEEQTTRNKETLSLLRKNASTGDKDAIWILDHLQAEGLLK